jgi:hypothetical protein
VTPASPVVVFGTETSFGRRVALALDGVGIAVTAVDVDLDDRVAVADAMTGEPDAYRERRSVHRTVNTGPERPCRAGN